jgi:predicted O-methyltransferase YrrM
MPNISDMIWTILRYRLQAMIVTVDSRARVIPGHLTKVEGLLLADLARQVPRGGVIVEIGSYLGRSTAFMAQAIQGHDVTIHCIDTWHNQGMSEGARDTYPEFLKNIQPWAAHIKSYRGFSHDIRRQWDTPIDFLWIDGDHSYTGVRQDIADWLPLVKKGGVVAFHDYANEKSVHEAVDEWQEDFLNPYVIDSIFIAHI